MEPGTSMCPTPESVSVYMDSEQAVTTPLQLRLGLNELLDKAATLHREPVPFAVYERTVDGVTTSWSAAVVIQLATGEIVAAWHSEPMFGSLQAALDHAEDMLGCELFPLICDDGGLWE